MAHACHCVSPGHCPWHDTITTREEFAACHDGVQPASSGGQPCIYLAELLDNQIGGQLSYRCNLHGPCTLAPNQSGRPACQDCKDRLRIDAPDLAAKFVDPLVVTDRSKSPTAALRNMLSGGAAFLVCGGPSLKQLPFQRLAERGVFSLGVNNVAGVVPISAFVCSDPPMKFHNGIFTDPKVMKFLPTPKIGHSRNRGRLREKRGEDFFWLPYGTSSCPNVWGFERRSWLMPDHTFLTDRQASWGVQDAGVARTGQPKTACTMLLGLRLLHYLGAKTVFLLGADFWMDPAASLTNNYAFAEDRDAGAIRSNNEHFSIVNKWFCEMQPSLKKFGFNVFNCYRESGLRAFPFVPFDDALEVVRGRTPVEPWDLNGWYSKTTQG